jgi:Fe-S-cluster containining protein
MNPAPLDRDEPLIDADAYRADLRSIYEELDAEVSRLAPRCDLSGRCCRFEEYGHTLFVSTLEAALLVADAQPPSRELDSGSTCPWQDSRGLCTARSARPLGCRIYFCDPSYQDHMSELSETFVRRLKSLADRRGLPWDYAPLHRQLSHALGARVPASSAVDEPLVPRTLRESRAD